MDFSHIPICFCIALMFQKAENKLKRVRGWPILGAFVITLECNDESYYECVQIVQTFLAEVTIQTSVRKVQWLWHSLQSGRFPPQRTRVRILASLACQNVPFVARNRFIFNAMSTNVFMLQETLSVQTNTSKIGGRRQQRLSGQKKLMNADKHCLIYTDGVLQWGLPWAYLSDTYIFKVSRFGKILKYLNNFKAYIWYLTKLCA